jgi:ketopantoate reductase
MREPVVVIGLGEMGRVFAGGLLRAGHPVYPVVRSMDLSREATLTPGPEMVLIAVGEGDLEPVLESLPQAWRDRACLLQNELLPSDWRDRGIVRPTVISVWFEKKPGRPVHPILPSPVYGPKAGLVREALGTLEIPAVEVAEAGEMLYELVRKNLYILTSNLAGLVTGGTVGDLWRKQRSLAREVAIEVLDIQEWLVREKLNRDRLLAGLVEAFDADPEHVCVGRSARERLARMIRIADEAGLAAQRIRKIQSDSSAASS